MTADKLHVSKFTNGIHYYYAKIMVATRHSYLNTTEKKIRSHSTARTNIYFLTVLIAEASCEFRQRKAKIINER